MHQILRRVWAKKLAGLPLLIAYILIGQKFQNRIGFIKWVTTFGIISAVVQIIELLRWVFVIPLIANNYVTASDVAEKTAAIIFFQTIHQFAGVLLGEHIGQLFTIVWTVMMAYAFMKWNIFPKWVGWLGISASVIYLLAQAELFATVIPGFLVWNMAGFIGSTAWLIWLIVIGIKFIKLKATNRY